MNLLYASLLMLGLFGGPSSTLDIIGHPDTNGGTVHVHVDNLTFANFPYFTVVGLSTVNQPFGNWTLVPSPDVIYTRTCDGNGSDLYAVGFPSGLPLDTHIWVQCWQNTSVGGGPNWEGSNTVELVVTP